MRACGALPSCSAYQKKNIFSLLVPFFLVNERTATPRCETHKQKVWSTLTTCPLRLICAIYLKCRHRGPSWQRSCYPLSKFNFAWWAHPPSKYTSFLGYRRRGPFVDRRMFTPPTVASHCISEFWSSREPMTCELFLNSRFAELGNSFFQLARTCVTVVMSLNKKKREDSFSRGQYEVLNSRC